MGQRTCSVRGCGRRHKGRGYCDMHLRRVRKWGDPNRVVRARDRRRADPLDRFWTMVDKRPNGCWFWTGAVSKYGYAKFWSGSTRVAGHRWIFEQVHGPIPAGMFVGHACHDRAVRRRACAGGCSCRHRRCVNPAHLELTTNRANLLSGNTPAAKNSRKTHCPKGHRYTPDNLVVRRTGPAWRQRGRECRQCQIEYKRAKRRAGSAALILVGLTGLR